MLGTFEEEFRKIEEEHRQRPKDELFVALSAASARAVIFGAGIMGRYFAGSLLNYLDKDTEGKLVAFCDNFKTGFSNQFQIPIISPDEMLREYKDAIIIVAVGTSEASNEIYDQVLHLGFPKEKVFRRYAGFELYSINELVKHYDGYKWAYDFFEDTVSKTIILNRIRGYLAQFELAHSPYEEQYFETDSIQFSEQEVFVDGGCFIGDTALEFIRRLNGKYDFIYGFEPEKDNYEQAKSNLVAYEKIELINKGLWSKADKLSFHIDTSSSAVAQTGEVSIDVTSLDEFFSDEEEKRLPTFIKLDIEGAEKEALLGMKNIIAKVHPKFAVCVYHKPEDIYELPQMIMQLGEGYRYKFKLRHYRKNMLETVLYAI